MIVCWEKRLLHWLNEIMYKKSRHKYAQTMTNISHDGTWQPHTVKCCYKVVQFTMILHTTLWYKWQKVNQILESQETPHISPTHASYGVCIVRIWEKIDSVITATHCIYDRLGSGYSFLTNKFALCDTVLFLLPYPNSPYIFQIALYQKYIWDVQL